MNDTLTVQREVEIVNRAGMHARPAAEFVKIAGRFAADIRVEKDGLEVNGKSIMGVLMLVASKGTTVTLRAKGERAQDSLFYLGQALMKLGQPGQACKAYAELEDVYASNLRAPLKTALPGAKSEAKCS